MKLFHAHMWENVLSKEYKNARIIAYKEHRKKTYGLFEYQGEIVIGKHTRGFIISNNYIKAVSFQTIAEELLK